MANEQIPEDLVREYEGEDLYSIGTHVPEKSFYKNASGRATMLQRVGESEQKSFDPMASK